VASHSNRSRHDEFEISDMLRRFGWIVPAYTMPPDAQHVTVLRVVIREEFSRTLADRAPRSRHHIEGDLPAAGRAPVQAPAPSTAGTAVRKKSELETQRSVTEAGVEEVCARQEDQRRLLVTVPPLEHHTMVLGPVSADLSEHCDLVLQISVESVTNLLRLSVICAVAMH